MFDIPIVFFFYKRLDCIKKSLEKIILIKPAIIFLVADGPKNSEEKKICDFNKNYVLSRLHLKKIKIIKIFSNKNLGTKARVISGLDYVFNKVPNAIILEDDCIPNESFFNFSKFILNNHSTNKDIYAVTGQSFQKFNNNESYYYSKYSHCWGWGTWTNRWKKFDKKMSFWPKWKKSINWKNLFDNELERKFWEYIYDKTYSNQIKSWNYMWQAYVWMHNGLIATPYKNLVKNIGFGEDSTNTKDKNSNLIRKVYEIKNFKINNSFVINKKNDEYVFFDIYFSNKFFLKNFICYYLLYLISNLNFLSKRIIKYLSKN
jgi:hypothetical protein